MKILISRCLLGDYCRYDGKTVKNEKVLKFIENHEIIPICPECDGGLPTPRNPSEIIGDKVVMNDGTNVTYEYNLGAKIALKKAIDNSVDLCILKARSPSCGNKTIYDGTFSGKVINGSGVTAKLLMENGVKVISEDEI